MIYTHEAYAGPYSMVFYLPEQLQNLTTKGYLGSLNFELHWWVIKLLAITKRPTSYWLKQDGNLYLCHVEVQTHRWKYHGGSTTIRDPGLCSSLLCHPQYVLPYCGPEWLLQFLPSCLHSSHEEGHMMKGKGTPPYP